MSQPKRFSRTTWRAPRSHNPGADASLNRLRVDAINLFYQHRVDPEVSIEDVAGA
jgi:aryl-alcohol dehydrogenase-like predicted oxidoreductase